MPAVCCGLRRIHSGHTVGGGAQPGGRERLGDGSCQRSGRSEAPRAPRARCSPASNYKLTVPPPPCPRACCSKLLREDDDTPMTIFFGFMGMLIFLSVGPLLLLLWWVGTGDS